jgi:hypothetical protein
MRSGPDSDRPGLRSLPACEIRAPEGVGANVNLEIDIPSKGIWSDNGAHIEVSAGYSSNDLQDDLYQNNFG